MNTYCPACIKLKGYGIGNPGAPRYCENYS